MSLEAQAMITDTYTSPDVDSQFDESNSRPTPVLRRSLHYWQTQMGLVIGAVVLLLVLLGPHFAPNGPTEFIERPFLAPSQEARLGTDYLGQDVLSRVLHGGRTVLVMAFAAASLGVLVGVTLGLVAGYARGWIDEVMMRALDVLLAFPELVLALLFVSLLGPELWLIVLLTALTWVPRVARVTRSLTMEIVEQDFVRASEILGTKRRTILLTEVLPNLSSPLLVEFALRLTWSVAAIASLSFLGFGVQPPTADWGLMVNENRAAITAQPWAVAAPVLCIAMFTVATSLIAEGFSRAVAGIGRQGDDR
jgi:peptide/nickel transport system permease protein